MKRNAVKIIVVVFVLAYLLIFDDLYALEFKAEKVNYDINTSETVCEENVVVQHEGQYLVSDKAKLNVNENSSYAEGSVLVVTDEETYLIGNIDFNFKTEEGTGSNGTSYKYPWVITGSSVEKKGNDMIIKDAVIRPSTASGSLITFKAKTAIIEDNKFLIIKSLTYYLGKVPVFWFPYMKKKITDDRTELRITPGKNSLHGYYVKTSYRYWFTPDTYGRLYLDFMEERGTGYGAEVGIESLETKGLLTGYYIEDENFVPIRSQDIPTGKDERYCANLKLNQKLPTQWSLIFQGNKQSDLDFYDDFFYDDFRNSIQRQNYLRLIKSKNNTNFSLLLEKRFNDFFTVIEKEPEIKYDYNNYFLEEYNVFHTISLEASRLNLKYADDSNEDLKNSRIYLNNELSYPMKFFGWLNLEPTFTMENIYYDNAVDDSGILRNVYQGDLDLFIKLSKVMYPEKRIMGYDRFRHVFEPHITYSYSPEPNYMNEEIISIDGLDGRSKVNTIGLSLWNSLMAKKGKDEEVKSLITGNFNISYSPDTSEFSDIGYKWDVTLIENLSLYLKGAIDKDNFNMLKADVDLAYYCDDFWGLAMGWIYRDESNSLISPEIFINIYDSTYIRGLVRYDIESEKTEYSKVSLVKQIKGMNIALQYSNRHTRDEESYMIVFSLSDYPNTSVEFQ